MRQALWRHHVEAFIERHPELTPAQREAIAESIALLPTRTAFDPETGQGGAQSPEIQEYKKRILAMLPGNLFYELFYTLNSGAR